MRFSGCKGDENWRKWLVNVKVSGGESKSMELSEVMALTCLKGRKMAGEEFVWKRFILLERNIHFTTYFTYDFKLLSFENNCTLELAFWAFLCAIPWHQRNLRNILEKVYTLWYAVYTWVVYCGFPFLEDFILRLFVFKDMLCLKEGLYLLSTLFLLLDTFHGKMHKSETLASMCNVCITTRRSSMWIFFFTTVMTSLLFSLIICYLSPKV